MFPVPYRHFNLNRRRLSRGQTKSQQTTNNTMKPTLAFLALSFGVASAFQVAPVSRTPSALGMGGFLEGKGSRITIRDDEDGAMWIEDKKAPVRKLFQP